MAYVCKELQGSLFRNDRKETDSHPDYKGSIKINGIEYWCSGWINKPKGKTPFMSLSFKAKETRQPGQDDF